MFDITKKYLTPPRKIQNLIFRGKKFDIIWENKMFDITQENIKCLTSPRKYKMFDITENEKEYLGVVCTI